MYCVCLELFTRVRYIIVSRIKGSLCIVCLVFSGSNTFSESMLMLSTSLSCVSETIVQASCSDSVVGVDVDVDDVSLGVVARDAWSPCCLPGCLVVVLTDSGADFGVVGNRISLHSGQSIRSP